MKKLLRAFGLVLGISAPILAGPVTPPAGNYIQLTNKLQSGATFYVSSGTVAGSLATNSLSIAGITSGNCLQVGAGNQVFGTGFACGNQGGILNQNTLQSGATFYVSSGTVAGQFSVVNGGSSYLTLNASNGASNPSLYSSGNLELGAGGNPVADFYSGTFNGIGGPSEQVLGNIVLHSTGSGLYFKQTTGIPGNNYISFIASQSVTTTQFVLPNTDGTSGQALTTDGNHNLSFTTVSGGAGGVTVYPASATIQALQGITGSTFSFTGPTPSTVTYGLAAGSLTVTGISGQAGSWQATEGTTPAGVANTITLTADTTGPALKEIVGTGATYYVTTSSVAATAGHMAGWGPGGLGTLVDIGAPGAGGGGTPGGSSGQLQYNNGGAFGGANSFVNSSSITVISSMSITDVGGDTNGGAFAGYLDVYRNTAFAGQTLFSVGSINTPHEFYVQDQTAVNSANGYTGGDLQMGWSANPHNISDLNISTAQKIDMGSTGKMIFETVAAASGGGDMVFEPETVTTLRLNSAGTTVSSSMTVTAPNTANYEVGLTTTTTFYHIAVSTNGHVITNGTAPTLSSCGTSPTLVGTDYAGSITTVSNSAGCILNFANSYGSGCAPSCTVSFQNAVSSPTVSNTSTTMTINSATGFASNLIYYVCVGLGAACR